MKKTLVYLFSLGIFMLNTLAFGQQLAAEKTIDLSSKADRGYLGHVEKDDAAREITLTYVIKSTNRKVKFETYTFDYDLKLVSNVSDEIELDKAKAKYSWFNFKGDSYVVEGVTASPNLTGTFVIKKKQITYYWNWFTGRYSKHAKILDKLKFEGENGKNMYYISHYENDTNGDIIALAGEKGTSKAPFQMFQKFHLFRVNYGLQILSDITIDLGSPQKLLYSAAVANEKTPDAEQNDWIIVLAPMDGGGIGKAAAPDPTQYTSLRISPEGKVISQTVFTTKAHTWTITGAVIDGDKTYLYGPGFAKDAAKKYYDFAYIPNEGGKFTDFQLVCLNGSKSDFVSVTSIAEFTSKARKPSDQKNPSLYNGKRVDIRDLTLGSNGQIYIIAQDFKLDTRGDVTGNIYTDLYLFQFDPQGNLVNSFGIDDDSRKGGIMGGGVGDARFYPTNSTIFEGKDPNFVYWMQFIPHHTKCNTETNGTVKTVTCYPVMYPRVVKLNTSTGEFVKIAPYGNGEYFLNGDYPTTYIEKDSKIIFIGETKNEKGLWIGKFDPSSL